MLSAASGSRRASVFVADESVCLNVAIHSAAWTVTIHSQCCVIASSSSGWCMSLWAFLMRHTFTVCLLYLLVSNKQPMNSVLENTKPCIPGTASYNKWKTYKISLLPATLTIISLARGYTVVLVDAGMDHVLEQNNNSGRQPIKLQICRMVYDPVQSGKTPVCLRSRRVQKENLLVLFTRLSHFQSLPKFLIVTT